MNLETVARHCENYEVSLNYLRSKGVLHNQPPTCRTCGNIMRQIKRGQRFVWRCPTHQSTAISVLNGSILFGMSIKLQQFIQILLLWSLEIPVTKTKQLVSIEKGTAIKWYAKLRDICTWKLSQNPIKVGGISQIVQIDETVISRRKYNRGRLIEERWVFGGICTETKLGFMEFVPDRKAATLQEVIKKYIIPGSTIHSDCWRGYSGIDQIPVVPRYQHCTVNHSRNFVDPITGVHTNEIENMWKNVKHKFKSMAGVHSHMVQSYIDEFLWRQRFGNDAFDNIMSHIAEKFS